MNPAAVSIPHQLQNQQVRDRLVQEAETSVNGLQERLNRVQLQIETNRADLRSVQQRIALQNTTLGAPPPTGPAHANGQHLPQFPPQGFPMNLPFGMPFNLQQQQMQRAPGHPPHPQLPSNTPASQHSTTNGVVTPDSFQQIPGQLPPGMTMTTESRTLRFPVPRPSSAPGQRPPGTGQQQAHPLSHTLQYNMPTAAQVLPTPGMHWPQMGVPQLPLPGFFSGTRLAQQPSNTTAWLLSSAAGPQALVFAPGHGFFSSISPAAAEQQSGVDVTNPQPQTAIPNATVGPQQPQPENQNQQGADGAVLPAEAPQPAAALVQAQRNGQENDLFAFIISRGWLFLRLYLFMFVFSEPGTWKRWIMIFLAALVCLQPRDGPFQRLMTAARRHFDNLVGPPAQQRQFAAVPPQQGIAPTPPPPVRPENEVQAQRPANVRGGIQMTPEEAAARIVVNRQQQQARPPRFWRDAFYRIEQSVALFLASLIPGVGERHVRAREEVREEQRREEERRRAEEEEAATLRAEILADGEAPTDAGPAGSSVAEKHEVSLNDSGSQSTSSAVQARDEATDAGELRNRT